MSGPTADSSFPSPTCLMQSAHLAVIDALMAVGAMEMVTAVKTRGSAELLGGACSWKDAVLHWVNVVRRKPKRNDACFKHTLLVYPVINYLSF